MKVLEIKLQYAHICLTEMTSGLKPHCITDETYTLGRAQTETSICTKVHIREIEPPPLFFGTPGAGPF